MTVDRNNAIQVDLSARYGAFRYFMIFSLYSDYFLPHTFGASFENLISIYLSTIYIILIFDAFFCVQYEKTDVSDIILFFNGVLKCGLYFHIFIFLYFRIFYCSVMLFFFKFLNFYFNIIRFFFFFWRPIFKKFGYLLNFFKKNNF